ncbi:MAG TPA: lactonase family protein [Acidisarcina sp.]|nr:lactonase family protein [Acidisarcina sp.]
MADWDEKQGMRGEHEISRRRVVAAAVLAPLAARGWLVEAATAGERRILLVGTQTTEGSRGIYSYRWDAAKGEMEEQVLAAEVAMPTFVALAPGGRHVYCTNELGEGLGGGPGKVTGFRLDRATRKLTEINAVSSEGAAPCHVALDRTARALFAANYFGGSAVSFRVGSDGRLSDAVEDVKYTKHGPNKERQDTAHAHRVTVSPDNRFLLVNDLGGDAIHIYRLDAATAKLTPNDPPQWKATPGSGPRSLRFHPNGRWVYDMNELDQTAELLEWDATAGTLTSRQRVQLTPDGPDASSTASESAIDRRGEFAYFAVRGIDSLITCSIDASTGKLTVLDRRHCGGKKPRHIALDPSERWLLVANEISGNIAVFRRDLKSGKLSESGKEFAISKPQCLVFA